MKNNLSFKKYLAFLSIVSIIGVIYGLISLRKQAHSIEIIGGADGPTAIFLTSTSLNPQIIYLLTFFLVFVSICPLLKTLLRR